MNSVFSQERGKGRVDSWGMRGREEGVRERQTGRQTDTREEKAQGVRVSKSPSFPLLSLMP